MTILKTFIAGAAVFAACIVISTPVAFAQASTPADSMSGMNMSAMKGNPSDESTKAFQAADHSMMSGMSGVEYTGNVDRDFWRT